TCGFDDDAGRLALASGALERVPGGVIRIRERAIRHAVQVKFGAGDTAGTAFLAAISAQEANERPVSSEVRAHIEVELLDADTSVYGRRLRVSNHAGVTEGPDWRRIARR